jgi:hypothetical protein
MTLHATHSASASILVSLHFDGPSAEVGRGWPKGLNRVGRRFKKIVTDLVHLALEMTNIENVWIEMAIAQRSNAKASIDASIRYSHPILSSPCTVLILFSHQDWKET